MKAKEKWAKLLGDIQLNTKRCCLLTNVRCLNRREKKILTGECLEKGNITVSREDNEGWQKSHDNPSRQPDRLRDHDVNTANIEPWDTKQEWEQWEGGDLVYKSLEGPEEIGTGRRETNQYPAMVKGLVWSVFRRKTVQRGANVLINASSKLSKPVSSLE